MSHRRSSAGLARPGLRQDVPGVRRQAGSRRSLGPKSDAPIVLPAVPIRPQTARHRPLDSSFKSDIAATLDRNDPHGRVRIGGDHARHDTSHQLAEEEGRRRDCSSCLPGSRRTTIPDQLSGPLRVAGRRDLSSLAACGRRHQSSVAGRAAAALILRLRFRCLSQPGHHCPRGPAQTSVGGSPGASAPNSARRTDLSASGNCRRGHLL